MENPISLRPLNKDTDWYRDISGNAEQYRLEKAFTQTMYVPTVIEIDSIVRVTNMYTVQADWALGVEYKNLDRIPEDLYSPEVRQTTCYPSSVLLPSCRSSNIVFVELDYEEFLQQSSIYPRSTEDVFQAFFQYDWWLSNLVHFVEGSSRISSALDRFFDLLGEEWHYDGTFYARTTHSCLELEQLQKSEGFISPTVITGATNYESLGGTLLTSEVKHELIMNSHRNIQPDRDEIKEIYNVIYEIHTNNQSNSVIFSGDSVIMRAGCSFVFEGTREFNGAMLVELSLVLQDHCALGVKAEEYYHIVEEGEDLFLDRFLTLEDLKESMRMMYESFATIVSQ